jgi:hypothetical protein
MNDETADRSAETPDRRGHPRGSLGEQSPLQARAAFLQNRSWEFVVRYNAGACARGGAQHGPTSEGFETVARDWAAKQQTELTLAETIDFLRWCHRQHPFLFFNGNTFAEIARTLVDFVLAELPTPRRREATSAVAHYIAGVLDREAMVEIVESLCASADLQPGDRVKTLRGSLGGIIRRILPDGRIAWQPDGAKSELIAQPETLLKVMPAYPDP